MAAGQAESLFTRQPDLGPVTICDGAGRPRWHHLWQGNPAVRAPQAGDQSFHHPYVLSGKGQLPYLLYPYDIHTGWRFSPTWKARDHRGHLYLTDAERQLGQQLRAQHGPYMIIEPPDPRRAPNRRGPRKSWFKLARAIRHDRALPLAPLQLAYAGADLLAPAHPLPHNHFRQALGYLSGASLLVCVEGGLAHMAAALGIPAVVAWGGCVSSTVLGYPEQHNIGDESPCGSLAVCDHCTAAWARLSVMDLLDGANQLLRRAG